jgi:hypothetical protein
MKSKRWYVLLNGVIWSIVFSTLFITPNLISGLLSSIALATLLNLAGMWIFFLTTSFAVSCLVLEAKWERNEKMYREFIEERSKSLESSV